MKVKELIKILEDLAPGAEVIMSSDGEGNNFSPLAEACGPYMYTPESTWSGSIENEEDVEADEFRGNAVVLWPTS
jgi:hypothetical protein